VDEESKMSVFLLKALSILGVVGAVTIMAFLITAVYIIPALVLFMVALYLIDSVSSIIKSGKSE
jgi:hypothetical protein